MPPQASPALVPGPQTLRSGEARANPGADPVRWEELGGWSRAVARTLGRGRMSQRRPVMPQPWHPGLSVPGPRIDSGRASAESLPPHSSRLSQLLRHPRCSTSRCLNGGRFRKTWAPLPIPKETLASAAGSCFSKTKKPLGGGRRGTLHPEKTSPNPNTHSSQRKVSTQGESHLHLGDSCGDTLGSGLDSCTPPPALLPLLSPALGLAGLCRDTCKCWFCHLPAVGL